METSIPPPYLLPLLLLHCYYRNNTTLQVKLQLTDLMAEEVKLSVKVSAAKEELAAAEAKLAAAKVELAAAKVELAAAHTDDKDIARDGVRSAQSGVGSAQSGVVAAQNLVNSWLGACAAPLAGPNQT